MQVRRKTSRVIALGLTFWSFGFGQPHKIETIAGGAPSGVPGTSVELGIVGGVAVDAAGNVFISVTSSSQVVRLDLTGSLTLVAGNGSAGFSGDNGPATKAQLRGPWGLAIDSAGSLYIADYTDHRVRKVSNGVITTVAGNGTRGSNGDDGLATSAQLTYPGYLAVDSAGNLYISGAYQSQTDNDHRVRKVYKGVITTVAGNGKSGFSGDNGPATSAQLDIPLGLAVDSAGSLHIADYYNVRVRKVSNGVITTVAGNGTVNSGCSQDPTLCAAGDGGPATSAQLYAPVGIAFDSAGSLYISENVSNRVRKVSSGVINTVAGKGTHGFSGDNGPALLAQFDFPFAIAVDSVGNLYIWDSGNKRIRRVSNGLITTVVGGGTRPVTVIPATMSIVNGNGQSGTIGSTLTAPLVVKVADSSGAGVPGVMVSFTANPASAAALDPASATTLNDGTASTRVTLTITAATAGMPSVSFLLTATAAVSPTAPTVQSVVHGGSFLKVPLAAGTWFSVLGANLGTQAAASQADMFQLGGASITVCGFPAILNYNSGPIQSGSGASSWQINALVPGGVSTHDSCPVVVTVNGQQTPSYSVTIADESLALFQFVLPATEPSAAAIVLPVITHADYSLVGPRTKYFNLSPAKAGETIILWGTGCKATTEAAVTINAKSVVVAFAGITGQGLCQLNVVVPLGTPSGIVLLALPDPAPVYQLAIE